MSTHARWFLGAAALLSAWSAAPARATYSLLIADRATGLIGSVGTSCVGRQAVSAIAGIAPGFGAIHAQAQSNANARQRGVMMLQAGATADEVIAAITAPGFDLLVASRQYGVVTLLGDAAGYTGSSNGAFAADRQMTFGDYVTSYQGNILTSAKVLTQLEESLRDGEGCDLPDALMLALEAGAASGEGDSRCTTRGIPADAGFLKVVDRDGKVVISLEVTNESAKGALVALRQDFDGWRATHGCSAKPPAAMDAGPAAEDAGTIAPSDARVPSAGSPGAPPRVDAAAPVKPSEDAGRRDAQVDDASAAGATDGESGCRVGSSSTAGWLLALATALALRTRQRRRA